MEMPKFPREQLEIILKDIQADLGFQMTKDEEERFLHARSTPERVQIVLDARERAYEDNFEWKELVPMSPCEGPPLPRGLNIRWPGR